MVHSFCTVGFMMTDVQKIRFEVRFYYICVAKNVLYPDPIVCFF